jgi:anaphase-promoting complex subunit 2
MTYCSDPFDVLFPAPTISIATPIGTPAIGFPTSTSPSNSFAAGSASPATQARKLVALSTAQGWLGGVEAGPDGMSAEGVQAAKGRLKAGETKDRIEALRVLLENGAVEVGTWEGDEDLVGWYLEGVRGDFRRGVGRILGELWKKEGNLIPKLGKTCELLYWSQQIYSQAVSEYLVPILRQVEEDQMKDDDGDPLDRAVKLEVRFSNMLHAMFIDSLPADKIFSGLSALSYKSCMSIFRINQGLTSDSTKYEIRHEASLQLMQLFENLRDVGFGGDRAVRAFAVAMEELVTKFVESKWMDVDWENQQAVISNLTTWMEKAFTPFIKKSVSCLTGVEDQRLTDESKQWLDMAIAWLGKSRIDHLFEYITIWPRSIGAVLDLKVYVKTPEARKYLTVKFQQDVARRLLHSGATTKHILDFYMLTIQVFTSLDSRGVLLDNVSRPIRRYLKNRTDTARIIISSMLVEPRDLSLRNSSEVSLGIAEEMLKPINLVAKDMQRQDYDLDYDNMNYAPQPNDASPDFKRNESNTAIAHLLSLYDQEQYVSVLRNIFGEHLLKTTDTLNLQKETHLLELFKARFGEDKLQACEVMLRDINESRRLGKKISKLPEVLRHKDQHGIQLNAQVLSGSFWPDLQDDEFIVPVDIAKSQELYEAGFQAHHNLMKLRWLPVLGRATVELHLKDRTVTESVPTWFASVINEFGSDDDAPIIQSVEDIENQLEMNELLVRNAISFWINKRVLHEIEEGKYTVLETLPGDKAGHSIEMEPEVSAIKAGNDFMGGKAGIYRNFITGMLKNIGSMPLARILPTLKMVLAVDGGFPYSENELKILLQGMVDDEVLTCKGTTYSIVK